MASDIFSRRFSSAFLELQPSLRIGQPALPCPTALVGQPSSFRIIMVTNDRGRGKTLFIEQVDGGTMPAQKAR
jgi:Cdc6-like AAA superfamily ATPase